MSEHPELKAWKELAAKQLKKRPLEELDWKTPEGILVKPLYTAEDVAGLEHVNHVAAVEFAVEVSVAVPGVSELLDPDAVVFKVDLSIGIEVKQRERNG